MKHPPVPQPPAPPEHLTPLAFELLLSGGAPAESGQRWRQHLQSCAACNLRLSEARGLGEDWSASPDAERIGRQLASAEGNAGAPFARPQRRTRARWWAAAFALPAAALAAWLLVPRAPARFTAKGDGALAALVQPVGSAAATPLPPDATTALTPGDRVQLTWSSARPGYLALLARDADGDVHRLFPETGADSAPVPVTVARPVGASLPVHPGFRPLRVWAVFADGPFALAPLVEELRTRGAIEARAGRSVEQLELAAGGGRPR
jgi:hypothetical protein